MANIRPNHRSAAAVAATLLLACAAWAPAARAAGVVEDVAAWESPSAAALRANCAAWLDACQAAPGLGEKVLALWPEGDDSKGPALLDRVAETAALLDARAHRLRLDCSEPSESHQAPDHAWLLDCELPTSLLANLKLYFARWLVHEEFHDEALVYLAGIEPKEVADPATLLFYRAVACHHLLLREQGLDAVNRLLAGRSQCPRRYVVVAELMQQDLEHLEDDTLDHIARRMEDVERRLGQGHAKGKVQDVERGIVESLDKMIEKLEQQQQAGSMGAGGIQSSSPAPDSALLGGKGPGDVDRKKLSNQGGWGDLPDKEREEAMQEIGREFPSHYRDIIEQFFRQLAADRESNP